MCVWKRFCSGNSQSIRVLEGASHRNQCEGEPETLRSTGNRGNRDSSEEILEGQARVGFGWSQRWQMRAKDKGIREEPLCTVSGLAGQEKVGEGLDQSRLGRAHRKLWQQAHRTLGYYKAEMV